MINLLTFGIKADYYKNNKLNPRKIKSNKKIKN